MSRVLNLLGAHLGPEHDLMPPKPDNPTGFWETLSVTQIHDDLFAELGGRWDRPPVLEPGWERASNLDPYVARIRATVESHFLSANMAVWKDPRGSMFLPLWRRVVPIEKIVVCVRRPEEVAGSLAAREGFDSERVAALWLRYVVAAWLDDAPHIVVTFEESHDSPRELARRLAEFIGTDPPGVAKLAEIRSFVDPNLRHYHAEGGSPGPIMQLARAVHALVTIGPAEAVSPILRALSHSWRLEARRSDRGADRRASRDEPGASVVEVSEG